MKPEFASRDGQETAGVMVERDCLLFEAGHYPDKGVTITEDDLHAIADNTPPGLPVRVEHLARSPFDGALGTVERLRVAGRQLWGTLRQPVEAWQFVRRAGARALSVGLDVAGRRLVETSFVCSPRVSKAQVFSGRADLARVAFCVPLVDGMEGEVSVYRAEKRGGENRMGSVRQFAEAVLACLRSAPEEMEASELAREQEALERAKAALQQERERLREERAERQILLWKREGRLRGTERAATLAKTLLIQGEQNVVTFEGTGVPVGTLFAQFVAENAPVVPMGEVFATDGRGQMGDGAQETLIRLAMDEAKRTQCSYVQAFARVAAQHPEMARQARETEG